jgi:putative ABC transport system permease protein
LYVTGEFASLGSNLLIVIPGKTETTGGPILGGVPRDLTVEDADALRRQVPEIRKVAPLALGTATAAAGGLSREVTVAGTTRAMKEIRRFRMLSGRYLDEAKAARGQRVAVLGVKVAQELFPGENPLGGILRLGGERFRVVGVMAPRGTSLGADLDEMVHIPVEAALKLFDQSSLFRILIEVRSHEEIAEARRRVLAALAERHGEEDVTVFTQDALLETFGNILAVLTAALGGIAAISLSVAGIGIMNVMLVSVSERVPEIGLLKAVGAGRAQVLAAFLAEATILSTAGGLLGLAAGWLGDRALVALYPVFPAEPPSWAVASAIGLSLAVGLAFGSLPAYRASRLDPVAALGRR